MKSYSRFATSFLRRRTVSLPLAATVATLLGAWPVVGATYYWDGATQVVDGVSQGGSGAWNTTSLLWDTGAAEVAWPNTATSDAFFGGATGTATLGSNITAGNLTFSTYNDTIALGTNTLTLSNGITGGGAFYQETISGSTGALTFSGGTGGAQTIALAINSTVISSAPLAGSDNLTITGGRFGLTSANASTFTGKYTVGSGGVLALTADNQLGAVPGAATADSITLNGGILQDGVANNPAIYSFGTSTSFTLGANRGIVLGANGGTIQVGYSPAVFTIAGVISGSGSLTKIDGAFVALTGANTYTGATVAAPSYSFTANGGIQLNSTGTLLNTASVTASFSSFTLDNSGTNVTDRLKDSAPISLNGGTFILTGNSAGSTETVGTIATTSGTSVLRVTPNSASTAALTSAGLVHNGVDGVLLVDGVGLGSVTTATNVGRVFLTATPALVGSTDGAATGIATGVTNTKIVPYLLGEATSTSGGVGTASGTADTFVTYNATTGLRPLNPTDEFASTITAGANTRVIAASTVATSTAINSLVVAGGVATTIADGATLTNTSGAILFTTTASSIVAASASGTGVLGFGTAEGLVSVNSGITSTISAGLTGSGGLTIGGAGILNISGTYGITGGINMAGTTATNLTSTLSGNTNITVSGLGTLALGSYTGTGSAAVSTAANTFTGKIVVNANGRLSITSDAALGAVPATFTADSITLNGGSLLNGASFSTGTSFGAGFDYNLSANRGITLGAYDNSTLTYSYIQIGYTKTGTINGVISGPGSLGKSDGGNLILTANNTYAGNTAVNGSALLQIGAGGTTGSLGTGPLITFGGGILYYNRSDYTPAAPGVISSTLTGGSKIYIAAGPGQAINLTGPLTDTTEFWIGNGTNPATTPLGTVIVTPNAATSLSNSVVVRDGSTLSISNFASIGTGNVFLGNSSTLGATLLYTGAGETTGKLVQVQGVSNFSVSNAASTVTLTTSMTQSAVGSFNKLGAGTLALAGGGNYTSPTNVSGGTLNVSGPLSATTGVAVTNNARFQISSGTNPINTAATATLGEATGNTAGNLGFSGGSSSATPFAQTLASLTLAGTSTGSTLDFGSGNSATFTFTSLASLAGGNNTFAVKGWTGSLYTFGATTDVAPTTQDRLLTTTALSDAQLANISFFNDAGVQIATGGHEVTYGGFNEIVPVPEPTTFAGLLAGAGLLALRRRRP